MIVAYIPWPFIAVLIGVLLWRLLSKAGPAVWRPIFLLLGILASGLVVSFVIAVLVSAYVNTADPGGSDTNYVPAFMFMGSAVVSIVATAAVGIMLLRRHLAEREPAGVPGPASSQLADSSGGSSSPEVPAVHSLERTGPKLFVVTSPRRLMSIMVRHYRWTMTALLLATGTGLALLAIIWPDPTIAPPPPSSATVRLISAEEAEVSWKPVHPLQILPGVHIDPVPTHYNLVSALDASLSSGRSTIPIIGATSVRVGVPSGATEAWYYGASACNGESCSPPAVAGAVLSVASQSQSGDAVRAIVSIAYCRGSSRQLCINGYAVPSFQRLSLSVALGAQSATSPVGRVSCHPDSFSPASQHCSATLQMPASPASDSLTVFVEPIGSANRADIKPQIAASIIVPPRSALAEAAHQPAPPAANIATMAFLMWGLAIVPNVVIAFVRNQRLREVAKWAPVGFVLFGPLMPIALIIWLIMRRFSRSPKPAPWTARFAEADELAPFIVPARTPLTGENIPLAHFLGDRLLVLSPGSLGARELPHVLVYAPTRSGKSTHAISTLLSWGYSAVVVDPKGELWRHTAGYVAASGRRPIQLSPGEMGVPYDPWIEAHSDAELRALAEAIAPAYTTAALPYAEGTQMLIVTLARLARRLQQPAGHVLAAALQLGPLNCLKALYALGGEQRADALRVASLSGADLSTITPERVSRTMLGQAWSGFARSWDLMCDSASIGAMSKSFLTPGVLRQERIVVYLHVPLTHADRYAPWLRLMTVSLVRGAMRHHDDIPLLVILDEAGVIGLPALPDLLAYGAGQGVTFIVYAQARSQLERWYGRDGLAALEANARCKLIWPTQDYATAEHVSRMLGKTTIARYTGQYYAEAPRELITADEFMKLPGTSILVLLLGIPPVIAQRIEWWNIPWMVERSSISPPPVEEIAPADVGALVKRLKGLAAGITFGKS